MDTWVETARKLRLMPLSFLASQDFQSTKLIFWTNVDHSHPLTQEIFTRILEQYSSYIVIKKFDAEDEFNKVALEHADDVIANVTRSLLKIFQTPRLATSSDLPLRLVEPGGAWMGMSQGWAAYRAKMLNGMEDSEGHRCQLHSSPLTHVLPGGGCKLMDQMKT